MEAKTVPLRLAYPVSEFCQLTATSRTKAYRLMEGGHLNFILIGSERRIPHSEIERIMKDGLAPRPLPSPKKNG